MVAPFIKALEKFINEPEKADIEELNNILKELNFKKEKVSCSACLVLKLGASALTSHLKKHISFKVDLIHFMAEKIRNRMIEKPTRISTCFDFKKS